MGSPIAAALIAAVVAVRTAGHRERRAVKEEAEILAALPTDLPSANLLRETMDKRLRGYIFHQTSVGRQVLVLGAWFYGLFLLAAGASLYLDSDSAPGWADGRDALWDDLADFAGVLAWVGLALWFGGYAFMLLEAKYGAGLASIRAVRDIWHGN